MNKRTYKCVCVFNGKTTVQYNLARHWVSHTKSSIFGEKWSEYLMKGINEFSFYANLRFDTFACFWQEEHVYEGFLQVRNPVRFMTGRF